MFLLDIFQIIKININPFTSRVLELTVVMEMEHSVEIGLWGATAMPWQRSVLSEHFFYCFTLM